MVGPGMSYKQMDTGDFIPSRQNPEEDTPVKDMRKIPELF